MTGWWPTLSPLGPRCPVGPCREQKRLIDIVAVWYNYTVNDKSKWVDPRLALRNQ